MATPDGVRPQQSSQQQQQGVSAGVKRTAVAGVTGIAGAGSNGGGVAVAGGSDSGSQAGVAPSNAQASASATVAGQPTPQASVATGVDKWKGRRVKRFKLVDELGEGAMGRVFLAEDTILKRHVALKLLPARHRDGRPNHRTERLVREARSAASLEHPNAVNIFEIDQSGGVHYIAMELVEGGNLEKLVEMSGPMDIERACSLVAEAAEALAHAHTRGIIHRDVKPANLLLARNGRCKVCDFGLALFDDELDAEGRTKCVGTPYYIAPEVAQGRGATAASDLYGLGCTMFFLLCGRAPFAGTNARELMKAHITQPLPDLRHWRSDVPDRLVMAIEQACAKDPAQRFESALHFAAVLRQFTISVGGNNNSGNGSGSSFPTFGNNNNGNGNGSGGGSGSMLEPGVAPISAAQLEAILPAAAMQANNRRHAHMMGALLWAGIGTVAATILIGVGVWMARSGQQQPAAPPPATGELKIADTKAAAPVAPAVATPAPAPATPSASTAAGEDALLNGSIEEADVDDGVAGWFVHDKFKPQVSILTENGNRFIRLTNSDPAKTVFADQRIRVDPSWKAINVSARMRASNFKAGKTPSQDGRVAFAFRDDKDVRIGNWPQVPTVKTDSPWVERTVTVDVPEGAKTLYIQLAILYATGTVDFDDVKVVPQIAK